MYPTLFRIPFLDFPISTFGVMLAVAFLVGSWITAKRMAEEGLDPDLATTLLIYVMLGGIFGSKLYYAVDVSLRSGLPFWKLFFARDGITWYGGHLMATAVGAIGCRIHRLPVKTVADCTAVAGAVGQALGRIGCFLVGDDYGRPTDLPWGVAFPRGLPPSTAANLADFRVAIPEGTDPSTVLAVHPTQLYEVTIMLVVFALLWTLRSRERGTGWLFAVYLMLAGLERFFVEIFRAKDDRFLAGFTIAQLTSVVLIGIGAYLYRRWRDDRQLAAGAYLSTVKK